MYTRRFQALCDLQVLTPCPSHTPLCEPSYLKMRKLRYEETKSPSCSVTGWIEPSPASPACPWVRLDCGINTAQHQRCAVSQFGRSDDSSISLDYISLDYDKVTCRVSEEWCFLGLSSLWEVPTLLPSQSFGVLATLASHLPLGSGLSLPPCLQETLWSPESSDNSGLAPISGSLI